MKLVADFKSDGLWVQYCNIDGKRCVTRAGRLWGSILTRTKRGGSFNTWHATTAQAEVGFSDFQDFAEWAISQETYHKLDLEGKHYELDKDILGQGSKIYSRTTCAFIPQHINKLSTDQSLRVGELPLGVSYHKPSGKYSAKLSSYNRRIWLGVHETPELASDAYRIAKASEIVRVTELYKDHLDRSVIFALYRMSISYRANNGERM